MERHLISKDSKGKIRVVDIYAEWNEELRAFVLRRETYQYLGKVTKQPDILIERGKAGRTVTEQCELEFKSHVKKYKDKGYKEIFAPVSNYSLEDLNEMLPEHVTDSDGVIKPMLAKDFNKISSNNIFEKDYYASRKIDGLRCLIGYKDNKIYTKSRGGDNYDYSMIDFINNPQLIEYFTNNPDVILDGEIYKHGWALEKISGIARLEKSYEGCDQLEFWIFDIADPSLTFIERLDILDSLEWTTNLFTDFEKDDLKIRIVPHEEVSGWLNIEKLHNKYVSEGFEGLVLRNPEKLYGVNRRSNDMIKVKMYREDTFKVIGIEQGLRLYDDMVFVCVTPYGKEFKAKPFGDRDLKIHYTENFELSYRDQKGDVKYFNYTNNDDKVNGVPFQPSFKAFRYDI